MRRAWGIGAGVLRLLLPGWLVIAGCAAMVTPTPTVLRPLSATATARMADATAEAAASAAAATTTALTVASRSNVPGADAAVATLTRTAAQMQTATAQAPTAVTTMPPNSPVAFAWQIRGEAGRLERVSRIATDGLGFVYLLDVVTHQVFKLDRDGQLVMTIGSEGTGQGQFNFRPSQTTGGPFVAGALAADQFGNLYVGDLTNRIQKFDARGRFVLAWGGDGSGDGRFGRLLALATDRQGQIYAIDGEPIRIQKFDGSGTFLGKWGREGLADGQLALRSPFNQMALAGSLTVDQQGNIYVADMLMRIQKFDATGIYLNQWGVRGNLPIEFGGRAIQLANDGQGTIFALDSGNWRVQVFNQEGNYLTTWGSQGSGVGQFGFASSIAIDNQGDIYVVESFAGSAARLQKFHPKNNWSVAVRGTPTPRPPTPVPTPTSTPAPAPAIPPQRPPSMTPTDR